MIPFGKVTIYRRGWKYMFVLYLNASWELGNVDDNMYSEWATQLPKVNQ